MGDVQGDAVRGDDERRAMPERPGDARTDEELRETREAQKAHGGSMAPGMVDATGHQVTEAPPGTPD